MPFLKKSKHAPVAAMTIPIINKNFPKSAIKTKDRLPASPQACKLRLQLSVIEFLLLTIVEKRKTNQ